MIRSGVVVGTKKKYIQNTSQFYLDANIYTHRYKIVSNIQSDVIQDLIVFKTIVNKSTIAQVIYL